MSGIVHVRHPVPVRYVPKGARLERMEFATAVTPVELVEVGASEMAHVHRHHIYVDDTENYQDHGHRLGRFRAFERRFPDDAPEGDVDFHEHDGALWQRLRGRGDGPASRRPLSREDLLAFLTGEYHYPVLGHTDLGKTFRRTPLIGLDDMGWMFNSGSFDPAKAREVVDDGAQSARDLRRFLDGNVRLAGDGVYLRFPGPLVALEDDRKYYGGVFPRSRFGNLLDAPFLPVRVDRVEGFAAVMAGILPDAYDEDPVVRSTAAHLTMARPQDDDLHLVACDLPRKVAREIGILAARLPRGEAGRLRDIQAGFGPWLGRGMLGALAAEEMEEVFSRSLAALRVFQELFPEREIVPVLAGYIEGHALPRLREAAPVADEDLDALSGLAMGGP